MSWSLQFLAVDIATVVVAALIAARVMISRPGLRTAQLIALIALCSICNAILGRDDYAYWIAPPYRISGGDLRQLLNLARNLTPALFMLLCYSLFAGRRRFPPWLAGLVVVQMLLEEPFRGFLPRAWPWAQMATTTTSTVLQTCFGVIALYWVLAGWRADLVEARRRIRLFTLAIIALDIVGPTWATRVLVDPNSVLNYQAHVAAMVSHLAVMIFVFLQLTGGDIRDLLEPARAPAPAAPAGVDVPAVLARLAEVMRGGLYRQRGLTLRAIADKVGLPEYRLRRIIHGELGFQNFNAFLHSYRIHDACAQLSDPALRRTPILTIALDAGYQSVNTFNRAFRDVMGVTPSAYRAAPTQLPAPGRRRSETT
jgi:AraC-like DNA-binding protein